MVVMNNNMHSRSRGHHIVAGVLGFAVATGAIGDGACFPASGNCFVVNETPGCDLAFCCAIVCGIDPLCCDVEWDSDCVQLAGVNCAM